MTNRYSLHQKLETIRLQMDLSKDEAAIILEISIEELEKLESGNKKLEFDSFIEFISKYDADLSTITGNNLDIASERIFRLYKMVGDREARRQIKLYLQALLAKKSFS